MKNNRIITAIVLGIASLISVNALGQNATKSLHECLRMAMENNLTLKSGRISIERAKEMQGTAVNLGNTSLSLSQDPTSGGSPDNSISISQSFDFPTVYGARKGLLKAETNLERSNLELTRNELTKEITQTYYQLLFAKEQQKILEKQDSIYTKFLNLATAKLKTGDAGRLEQMNAERLCNENKIALQKADRAYQNIQLALQRWTNTEELIEPVETELRVFHPSSALTDFSPEQTPAGEFYANKKSVSEKNLSLVKQGYLPSFNISLSNQFLIKGFNPYHIERKKFDGGSFMGFEAGVSVPLFFWEQRAKTKVAKRDVEIAHLQQQDALLAIRKEYQSCLNNFSRAKNALDYYTGKGMKQAEEIARISQISYEKGEINYVEYIQNLKSAVEIRLQYAEAVNDYNQTVIMLNYLQGNK